MVPFLKAEQAAGNILAYGWAKHWEGGDWRRLEYVTGTDLDKMVDSRAAMIKMIQAPEHAKAMDEFDRVCASHDDYIWSSKASSQALDAVARTRSPFAMSTYYECGADQNEADAIVSRRQVPPRVGGRRGERQGHAQVLGRALGRAGQDAARSLASLHCDLPLPQRLHLGARRELARVPCSAELTGVVSHGADGARPRSIHGDTFRGASSLSDSEKRGAQRIPFPCEVECTGAGDNPLNPRISDLSATGAFIDSMIEVPAGSRMRMKFTLPDGTAVAVGAEVVHSMPHFGMGVRFLDLTDEQRGAIERFVSGAS